MFCQNCGTEIKHGAKFCTKCGIKLNTTHVTAPNVDEETLSPNISTKPILPVTEIQKPFQVPPVIFSFIGAALVAGAFLFLVFFFDIPIVGTTLGQSEAKAAYKAFQEIVLDNVNYPESTEFPRYDPDFIEEYVENVTIDDIEYHVFEVTAEIKTDNLLGISVKEECGILIGFPVDGNREDYIYEFVDSE